MNSPGCPDAEPIYKTILTKGLLNQAFQLFDPKYPESILAEVLHKPVLLPYDLFLFEQQITTNILVKSLRFDTTPPNDDAIRPGAISGLVRINDTLFICRPSDMHQSKFIVHRPVISSAEEQIILQLLTSKIPNALKNISASSVWSVRA